MGRPNSWGADGARASLAGADPDPGSPQGERGAAEPKPPDVSLLPHHRENLKASSITPEVIQERGYFSATKKIQLEELGFPRSQRSVPALVMPVHSVTGETSLYVLRPDTPRLVKGRTLKYEIPRGARMQLDVPPRVRHRLGDPAVPLFLTEGTKKADAAASRGLCCVCLIGVWNWRGTNELGGKTLLPDFEYVHLEGREVYVAYDSDVMLKRPVHEAMARLGAVLEHRKAKVRYIYLPSGEAGTKVGLDDYFAQEKSVDDLLTLATEELRSPPQDRTSPHREYLSSGGSLYRLTPRGGRLERVRLTTFTARILFEETRDDGLEKTVVFEVEGMCEERVERFRLSAAEFTEMRWPPTLLGTGAYVLAKQRAHHHAANAIQACSADAVERRMTYTHTGWRKIDGAYLYLHGEGAIGEHGLVADVSVDLPEELAAFVLPEPPAGAALHESIDRALDLLKLGPPRIAAPVFCAPWRAVVSTCSQTLALTGETGAFKTEIAALSMAHFGDGFRANNLPTGFTSTPNFIEALGHAAKDAVLAVDDFAPQGSRADISRGHTTYDRIVRSQGNSQGRGRLRPDGTPRPTRRLRCLMLTTGESDARMRSAQARCTSVRIRVGDVDANALTQAQDAAANGHYAGAMAAYLMWLARRRTEVLANWERRIRESRRTLLDRTMMHRRVASNFAELLAGGELFCQFAFDVGAIDRRRHDELVAALRRGLQECAVRSARDLAEADPVERFRALLGSALRSGQGHITNRDGSAPESAQALGWRLGQRAQEVLLPCGDGVGWIDAEYFYLEASAAFRIVQDLGEATGQSLTVDPQELKRQFKTRGLLLKCDKDRFDAKVNVAGARVRALHLPPSFVLDTAGDAAEAPPEEHGSSAPAEEEWGSV